MGVDLYRESGQNEPEERWYDTQSILAALLHRSWGKNGELLASIDPYGVTVFGHKQFGKLIAELKLLQEYCKSDEERTWLANAIAFVKHLSKNNADLRFVGD